MTGWEIEQFRKFSEYYGYLAYLLRNLHLMKGSPERNAKYNFSNFLTWIFAGVAVHDTAGKNPSIIVPLPV